MTRLPPLSTLFPYTTLFRSLNSVDYEKVLAFKDKIVSRLHKGVQGLVKARKIDYIEGFGRLTGPKDRKSTRLNSSHVAISYAVFCLKKKKHYLPKIGNDSII